MNICLESEFFEVENKIKHDIIVNKRSGFIDGVKKFISALSNGFIVHSTNFFLGNWEYSEKSFPFRVYKHELNERKDIGFIVKYIYNNWSKYVIAKKTVNGSEYSIMVNGMRLCDVLQNNSISSQVKDGITFTTPMFQLMDITYNLYSPFPEFWEENILLYKELLSFSSDVKSSDVKSSDVKSSDVKSSDVKSSDVKSSDVKSSDVKSSDVSMKNLKSELEDYIIKNLKYIDLGLILFTDKKIVNTFGLRFISNEDIENKLFLLTRTFLDSKNEERKIVITRKQVQMDFIQYYDLYVLKLTGITGDVDEFPIVRVYNNLSYEIVHYSGNKTFAMCSVHILLKEYLSLVESKEWSDNYKQSKKQGILDILGSHDEINKFLADPSQILKYNYAGIYKDLKIERRKHISQEYVYGEKRTFYYTDFV